METTVNINAPQSVFKMLHIVFVVVPVVAGLDKFFNILCDWTQYISPMMENMLPFSPHIFMMIVGVIEIVAGILVFIKPKIGGLIVSAWLTLIALSLLISWHHPDVAVRDLVMAISAFSMSRLSIFNDKA